jgi:hypothetical protein
MSPLASRAGLGSLVARQRGFALLALLASLGALTLMVVFAVASMQPAGHRDGVCLEERMAALQAASLAQFRQSGQVPVALPDGVWIDPVVDVVAVRQDPYGNGIDLQVQSLPQGLLIRSSGPDRQPGNADDVTALVSLEVGQRQRQRARLRLLRAVAAVRLQAAVDQATLAALVPPPEPAVAPAMRELAKLRREDWSGSLPERVARTARMAELEGVLLAHQAYAGWMLPAAVTGAGGLMQRLGLSDALAVDGLGRPLRLHATLGVVAIGNDGIQGTNDDME